MTRRRCRWWRHVLARACVAFVLVGGYRGRPHRSAQDHHRRPDRERHSGVDRSRAEFQVGTLRIWHMAVAAGVFGVAPAFFFPAYSAFLPRILPAGQLLAANGLEGVIRPALQRGAARPPPACCRRDVPRAWCLRGRRAVRRRPCAAGGPPLREGFGAPAGEAGPHLLHDLRGGFWFIVRTPWLFWTLLFASILVLVVLGPRRSCCRSSPGTASGRCAAFGFLLAFFGSAACSARSSCRRDAAPALPHDDDDVWVSAPCPYRGRHHRRSRDGRLVFVFGFTDGAATSSGERSCNVGSHGDAGPGFEPRLLRVAGPVAASMAIAGPLSEVLSMETILSPPASFRCSSARSRSPRRGCRRTGVAQPAAVSGSQRRTSVAVRAP